MLETLALKSGQVDIVYRPEVESLESFKDSRWHEG
ncbi:ABC-type transport system substrate-binding protein [Neobacillus niacini]|nr:ABC-type transport system substrate-binding protein [Neobacillus niacini]